MLAWLQVPCLIGIKPVCITTTIPNGEQVIKYLMDINKPLAYNIAMNSALLVTDEVIELFVHYRDVRSLKQAINHHRGYICFISNICMRMNELGILYQLQLSYPNWCTHMRDEFFTTYCPNVFLGLIKLLRPDQRRLCYVDAIKQDNVRYLKLLVDNYGWEAIIPYNVIACNAIQCLDYIKGYLVWADITILVINKKWKLLYTIFRSYIFFMLLCIIVYYVTIC